MKQLLFVFCVCLSFVVNSHAQNSFEISFATEEDDFVNRSLIDPAGNVLLIGALSHSLNTLDAFIIKVAPDGKYQFKRIDRSDTISLFSTITLLDNGHYFVTGAYSAGGTFYDMNRFWVMIFDQNLEVISEQSYGIKAPYLKYGGWNRALINQNGEVAIIATNERLINNVQRPDFIMFKFNQQGDSLSSVQYESFPSSVANSFDSIPGSDSLMMIGKGVLNTGQESINFMDLDMNITSSINISDVDGDFRYTNGNWISSDEFLMLADRIVRNDKDKEYFFSVFRVNTAGQNLQELELDRPDTLEYYAHCKNMVVAPDSLIYVGGKQSYNTITSTPSYPIIYLIDKDLNLIGRKEFGGDGNYSLMGIEATPDNGCFAYAERYNIHNKWYYERDIVMWKFLRKDFEIITQLTDKPAAVLNSKVWPNPALDVLHISLDGLQTGSDFRLRIYNTAGQKYFDKAFKATAEAVRCHIEVLPAGTYVYELQTADGQVGGGKFIKQ
ncbi:MAG: T9SS type A sorting domain-containing protein [Bacteroidales bacterium]|nr:T9SS type A sorting domain-containing protein [Bacteroidales bacterium]